MRKFGVVVGAACCFLATGAAASGGIVLIQAPAYSEAIYGTPEDPLIWFGPTLDDVIEVHFSTYLSDMTLSFEIHNATANADVGYGNGVIGVTDANGFFAYQTSNAGIGPYDFYWSWLRVGERWPNNGAIMQQAFDLTNVQVTGFQPRPVPEPATWALMIAGFGIVGRALRRREIAQPA